MIVLGILLLILGVAFGISILQTLGILLLVAGVILVVLGGVGHPVGGRRYWW